MKMAACACMIAVVADVPSPSSRPIVLRRFAQFLAEPPEHPRLRHPHGAGTHPQLERDVPGVPALDGGRPERLPGAVLELVADQVEAATEQAPILGARSRESSSSAGPAAGTFASRTWASVPPTPPGSRPSLRKWSWTLLLRDRPEPAPERIAGPLLPERRDMGGHRLERRPGGCRRYPGRGAPSAGTIGRPAAHTG